MRSLLLHVYDDDCLEARLQAALDLARFFDAHLTCMHTIPFGIVVPGDLYGTLAADVLIQHRKNADAFREKLEARLQHEDVSWDWLDEDGPAASGLVGQACLSDLVIMGAPDRRNRGSGDFALIGDLVIHARTPLLAVPQSAKGIDCEAAALVAWNGSPEASHALRGALPLLKKAAQVYLASVTERKGTGRAELPSVVGAEYLSRHGITCEMVELPEAESIAETLQDAARSRKAGYMVMGAYGHSRFRESVLGGVSRDMLSGPALPLFLCH